jgi:uncharacterized protein (DUF2336 family)
MAAKGAKPEGQLPEKLSRDQVLGILEEREKSAQHELATRKDAGAEVLYYLASKGAAAIRRAVAGNLGTPAHANRLLADDADDEVRAELARKIGRLMPDLAQEESEKLRALTLETLEKLANDQLPRVRAILAEEIKSLDCVPKQVIRKLAFDLEMIVATPILDEALAAIAKRKFLSANVADAIVTSLEVPAVAALLANPDAQVREDTLNKIIEQAENIRAWHQPLVMRVDLSQRAIRRIASFVGMALIEVLSSRQRLDPETRDHLNHQLRHRIDKGDDAHASEEDQAAGVVEQARRAGKLDDGFVDAAAEAGKREVVAMALAVLAQVPLETVRKILAFRSAKPVTALAWRAKLSMRVAFRIQRFVMKLPTDELLPAREGVRFPLTDDEMRWHLSYFDVAV